MKRNRFKKFLHRGLTLALTLGLIAGNVSLSRTQAFASGNSDYVYQFLTTELGLNSAAACGVLANIEKESDFNPTLSVLDTNGKYTLGICQWNGGRKTALENYAGSMSSTIEWQLKFLKHELATSEKNAWTNMNLRSIPNTQEGAGVAAGRWARYFERCAAYYCPVNKTGSMYADCGSCRYQYGERMNLAEGKYWSMYGDGSSYSYSASDSRTGSEAGGSNGARASSWKYNLKRNNKNQNGKLTDEADFASTYSMEAVAVVCTSKPAYSPDEKITVVRNDLDDVKNYTLEIWQEDELLLSQKMKESVIDLDPMEEGRYTAYIRTGDDEDEISDPYDFLVENEMIGKAVLTSEKTSYAYNETLTLTRNDVPNTTYYWLTIMRDGKEIVSQLMTGKTYQMKHPIEGNYTAYLQVGNTVSGHETSEAYEFQVAEHDHVWGTGKVTKEPTATESGIRTYTCSCLHSYTEVIPPLGSH